MEKNDISQLISVVLSGSNYHHWCEAMHSFLKERKLWRFVIGDLVCPKQTETETTEKFVDHLEWGIKEIIILLHDFEILLFQVFTQFGQFNTTKGV